MADSEQIQPKTEFSRGANKTTPDYLKTFVNEQASALSTALRQADLERITALLRNLSTKLPKDMTFKELVALICGRKNGDLFITAEEGTFDNVPGEQAGNIFDDLIQRVPMDSTAVLILHTHPSKQSIIGPVPSKTVEFSENDRNNISKIGGKLGVFDLEHAYVGLLTANSKSTVVIQGENQGRAFGWNFNTDMHV